MEELTKRSITLAKLNDACRLSFVVLFMVVRAGLFPYVTLAHLAPDILAVLPSTDPARRWELYAILGSAAALTCLQLHWARLIVLQIAKEFSPKGNSTAASM